MRCTRCGLRESTTEVVQSVNNHVERMYLCDECAKAYRPSGFDELDVLNKLMKGSSVGVLSGLAGMFDAPMAVSYVCPECKTTGDEFLKTGFVGCPHCYEVFEPLIVRTVKKLQQSDRHVGKSPYVASTPRDEREALRAELQAAIDSFDYKRAGEISAKLDAIEGNGGV